MKTFLYIWLLGCQSYIVNGLINPNSEQGDLAYRINPKFIPIKYDVYLKYGFPYGRSARNKHNFLTVDLFCNEETDTIELHTGPKALGTTIDKVRHLISMSCNNRTLPFESLNLHYERQTSEIKFNGRAKPGERCQLKLWFDYSVQQAKGTSLNLGAYGDKSSIFHIVTQGEAMGMRRIFPCFDEPKYKARFVINIILTRAIDRKVKVLSNMPLEKKTVKMGLGIHHKFQETPLMSTYLVAIVIAEYKLSVRTEKSMPKVTVWGSDNQKIASLVRETVLLMRDSFQVIQPLAEVEYSYVTSNITGGGMENWGLVISTGWPSPYISSTVVHEVVHYYFGNLVTCNWWDDIWLNEGITEFYTFKLMEWLQPKFFSLHKVEKTRIFNFVTSINNGIKSDNTSLVDKRHWFVAGDNDGTFYVYSVGAQLMLMTESIFGVVPLHQAMRNYLTAHQFSTTTSSDLVNALQGIANEIKLAGWAPNQVLNVETFLHPYLYQNGAPVIEISFYKEMSVFEVQQKCLKTRSECNCSWNVPVQFGFASIPSHVSKPQWLIQGQSKMTITKYKDFSKFDYVWNHGCKGLYLVNATYISRENIIDGEYKPTSCDILQFFLLWDLMGDSHNKAKLCASRNMAEDYIFSRLINFTRVC